MKAFSSVLFDLDGTVVDTAQDLAEALNALLQQHSQPTLAIETIRPYVSAGTPALLQLGFNLTPADSDYANKAATFAELYQQSLATKSKLFTGIQEVLDFCRQQALPWGIVTNKPERFTTPLMRHLKLDSLSHSCVSGDTLPLSKPHPEPLLLACQQMHADPKRCLYIGDAERDIIAGKRAGMQTAAALYGYLLPNVNPQDWNATFYVEHPLEILKLLG